MNYDAVGRSKQRSPEVAITPPMTRGSSDRTAGETTKTSCLFSRYPCDPRHPRFVSGRFLDRGLRGLRGWARHRDCGPERANQSVEATATRTLASMTGAGDSSALRGRRASPWRSADETHLAYEPT
jgi:hypothetical protein